MGPLSQQSVSNSQAHPTDGIPPSYKYTESSIERGRSAGKNSSMDCHPGGNDRATPLRLGKHF